MKKDMVILGILLFCLVLAVSGCRYPIKAVDFVADVGEEIVFLGDGEELAPIGETEAEHRARWSASSVFISSRSWKMMTAFGSWINRAS